MNIDTQAQITTTSVTNQAASSSSTKKSDTNFAEELTSLSKNQKSEEETKTEKVENNNTEKTENTQKSQDNNIEKTEETENTQKSKNDKNVKDDEKTKKDEKTDTSGENTDENIDGAINGLNSAVAEINSKLNQKDENFGETIKNGVSFADKNENEADNLINNDMNIKDVNEQQFNPQMSMNMNFNNEGGQPFADFLEEQTTQKLAISENDLKEEAAILSTMDENLAIANKNMALKSQKSTEKSEAINNVQAQPLEQEVDDTSSDVKTVINSEGIKKVDKNTNVTVETVVKYDNVIMDKSDVEFFTNLVENGSAEVTQQTAKNSQVSKTLADLIAKSMNDNKPVRIDFDNNISVIIKVGKEGKISADFLPSSQVAEAYLKENLPILKQRFDDNNIEYDELNQRKQQKQDEKENRKKGRQDE